MSEEEPRLKCPYCGYEIDPDWCWCGDSKDSHQGIYQNHFFIPMGCHCGHATQYPSFTEERNDG
jgi:hypothetical protein